ncbi:MAG: hypothetical protein GQ581_08610 [Methyloprofundus sp.]|nr:hypothetical protein [Methyloprofundus sp.]
MNNSSTEIDRWLIEDSLAAEQSLSAEIWDANFNVDRQLVFSKFGPYSKLFLRPEKFVKRFYHTLYPLVIDDWPISIQSQLHDGFCTLDTELNIRFQATFLYAKNHIEILSEINEHIKSIYYPSIIDTINSQLLKLNDDAWVRTGLGDIEKSMTVAINEMLILDNIQSQVVCTMSATFIDFPEVQLGKEHLYLTVLKKSFAVTEQQCEELFRQEQLEQQQQLTQKQQQLEQLEKSAELDRVQQAQQAEYQQRLLLDQEEQQQRQFAIQARLHVKKVQHASNLKETELEIELQEKQQQAEQIRIAEQQTHMDQLAHHALLKEKEIHADIEKYELKHASWLAAKNKKHELQLEHDSKQKQLKFDMDIANQKHQEQQRLAMQEQSYASKKNSDIYLRREIELLELDKKRLELQLAIKDSKNIAE